MMKNITKAVTSTFYKAKFLGQKHAPEILVAAGIIGTITGSILACKASMKLETVLKDARKDIDNVKQLSDRASGSNEGTGLSKTDTKKAITAVYAKTGMTVVQMYAPAVGVGALSIFCILASYNIMHKRNVAITAAYVALDNTFKDYRKRVIERFGEIVDQELRYNIRKETVTEQVVDPETGEVVEKTKEITVADNIGESEYARFFDEYSDAWTKSPEYNLAFLRAQQNYANDLLVSRGYVFLNEVYKMLGLKESKAGQVVGWIYDPNNSKRDNYISFGIYDIHKAENRKFVNGYERSILLDFNVDGPILDILDT